MFESESRTYGKASNLTETHLARYHKIPPATQDQSLSEPPLECAQCAIFPPSYRSAIVPWLFRFPVDFIVHELKFNNRLEMGRLAGSLLAVELERHFEGDLPELLIPVPLGLQRLKQRGFNQAYELVRWMSVRWDCQSAARASADLVWRTRDTDTQAGLDRQARFDNLQGVFGCDASVAGKSVLLVDDVMTTGSTLEQLAAVVAEAGASSVDVCAFARTPPLAYAGQTMAAC